MRKQYKNMKNNASDEFQTPEIAIRCLIPYIPKTWWIWECALRDDPIWTDLPEFKGHAMIDMWFVDYRKKHKMIDVVPTKTLCYHQAHLTSAVAPSNERPEAK